MSTSPVKNQTHWKQAFLPLNEPINVKVGDIMIFELHRPEFGEWTWTVETGKYRQRQSTFFSEPVSLADLHKNADINKAVLSQKGQAAREVLEQINNNIVTTEIIEKIAKDYPFLFPNQARVAQFVKDLVVRYR